MKQEQFLDTVAPDVARARWYAALDLHPMPSEAVPLAEALGRVLAADVVAATDVPGFDRANVDGWAVRAEDTFSASEREPARLSPTGEEVPAGAAPKVEVGPGEASVVATGAVIPRGADAMVMVEDSDVDADGRVLVSRPATPGAYISAAGSDVARGETVLRKGTRLTARETGTLAACGFATIACVRRPRVGVLSTGDELVPPGADLAAAGIHDANATLVADATRELGAEATILGIVRDEAEPLRTALSAALAAYDVVVLSGGTSKGGGDVSYRIVEELADVRVHGVALKPGKPLCLAAHEGKAVVVLPGFPTSAIFTYHAFVAPLLRRRLGARERPARILRARLPRAMRSVVGRAEFTLVNLVPGREGWIAFPLGKGSGSVTTFARADGFFEVPAHVERVDEGEDVEVTLLSPDLEPADLVVVGSHCTGLDVLVSRLQEKGLVTKVLSVGSGGGLDAARQGACDVAPVHLWDPETSTWNEAFAGDSLRLLVGYGRRQGLAYRKEHEAVLGEDGAVEGAKEALQRAAADPSLRMANRNPSSGTRALAERLLDEGGVRPSGWHTAYRTHGSVAATVLQGRADWGLCIEQAARAAGLAWRPLEPEHYDFLVPVERWEGRGVRAFREVLAEEATREALANAGFEVAPREDAQP